MPGPFLPYMLGLGERAGDCLMGVMRFMLCSESSVCSLQQQVAKALKACVVCVAAGL